MKNNYFILIAGCLLPALLMADDAKIIRVHDNESTVAVAGQIKSIVVKESDRVVVTLLKNNTVESMTTFYSSGLVARVIERDDPATGDRYALFDDNGDGNIDRKIKMPKMK